MLVVGAAGLDVKGQVPGEFVPRNPYAAYIRHGVGGVARNIAENLARLDVPTVLLTAVGDDHAGRYVLQQAESSGIDTDGVFVIPGEHTGSYLKVVDQFGAQQVILEDFNVIGEIKPAMLSVKRGLFRDALLIVIDANLSYRALDRVFSLARHYDVRVCADPTSNLLVERFEPYLSRIWLFVPNYEEASILCDCEIPPNDRDSALEAARQLVARGVYTTVVTMGEAGLVYASADGMSGHVPAIASADLLVDTTGASDALMAATIFGLLNDIPLDESVQLGASAAYLTLRTRESVRPDLTQEMLYGELPT